VTPVPPTEQARWFAEQVQPHDAALRAYLTGLVAPSDVDDIVQDTYARLLRAQERGPIDSPRGLLFATARNVARDMFRRRATANTVPIAEIDSSRVFDDGPGVAEVVSRRQEEEFLMAAIDALPPRSREIFLLRKFENF
jgi:RNA polymerase sigma factor (sigma-70 family)